MVAASLLFGVLVWSGCGRQAGKVLGQAPRGTPRPVLAVRAGDTPPVVTIEGKLVEKCPVAGCWFRVQDTTGMIKVDTKAAGFVVTSIPLGKTVTVGGKVQTVGEETLIEATGLRF